MAMPFLGIETAVRPGFGFCELIVKNVKMTTAIVALSAVLLVPAETMQAQSGQNPADNPQNLSTLKQLSLEELADIRVTSESKQPVKLSRSPAAVYVITRDDIRRSGVTTIVDALRLAPGVEVARIDGNEWSVGIRGFGTRLSRSVLVLIDGRTVYTPLFAGTYWEVQDTLLQDIDRIEIIRGPGGTIWGPNAINGVISIITRNGRLNASYSYLHMNLTQPAGSLDTQTAPNTAGSSPAHEGVVQSFLDLPKHFELNAVVRYVSALPTQGVVAYTTADANLVWHWRSDTAFSIAGQNLLQPEHPEYGGDPGPLVGIRRSIYARLTWSK